MAAFISSPPRRLVDRPIELLQIRSVDVAQVVECIRQMTEKASVLHWIACIPYAWCLEKVEEDIALVFDETAQAAQIALAHFRSVLLVTPERDAYTMRRAFHGFVNRYIDGLCALRDAAAIIAVDPIPRALHQGLRYSAMRVQALAEALNVAPGGSCGRWGADMARLQLTIVTVCGSLTGVEEREGGSEVPIADLMW